ncbi:unnamed protein product [Phytophthora lilii]|uniref:Unnamed protein product n=1 Tax=Phytophthora lilii TaxID=2077276 RepID=A0A9W6TRV5_9STRA|nr:unnamed protein product [Phytophthora lilii]
MQREDQMDILGVDVLPGHEGEAADEHALLRLHDASDDAAALTEDAADYEAAAADYEAAAAAPAPHRPGARRRRKIGKALQLVLLRKYVQCAKQFSRLPDRATTEQLLQQGYDEFYYQGGNLNEPRLSYAAFLKLVRNRRSEVARQAKGAMATRGPARRGHKEQQEIRALIDELESVRHGQRALDFEADGAVPILSDSSSIMGDAGTDGGVSAGDLSTAETYSSVMAAPDGGADDVVVSRTKLDLMLRVAQETLLAQKKILEEVRAMEQRVAGIH